MWSKHVKGSKNVKNERSFKKMNINFAKTIEFLEWATFLEHSRKNFADQMITGPAKFQENLFTQFVLKCKSGKNCSSSPLKYLSPNSTFLRKEKKQRRSRKILYGRTIKRWNIKRWTTKRSRCQLPICTKTWFICFVSGLWTEETARDKGNKFDRANMQIYHIFLREFISFMYTNCTQTLSNCNETPRFLYFL